MCCLSSDRYRPVALAAFRVWPGHCALAKCRRLAAENGRGGGQEARPHAKRSQDAEIRIRAKLAPDEALQRMRTLVVLLLLIGSAAADDVPPLTTTDIPRQTEPEQAARERAEKLREQAAAIRERSERLAKEVESERPPWPVFLMLRERDATCWVCVK